MAAPARLAYLRRRTASGLLDQPLTGWFGHAEPFRFDDGYRRADGIRHMLCSTPQMLSMAAFEKALDAFAGVSMAEVERKGRALGDLMIALHDERLSRARLRPRDVARRRAARQPCLAHA